MGEEIKNPGEVVADAIKETGEKVEKSIEANKEEVEVIKKSLSELTEGFTEVIKKMTEEPKESEAMLEMKSEMKLMKAQNEAANKGVIGGVPAATQEQIAKSKAFVEKFASLAKDAKMQGSLSSVKMDMSDYSDILKSESRLTIKSSLNTFDNVSTGFKVSDPTRISDVEIVGQPVSRISPFVNNVSAASNVIYDEFDTSYIDLYESKEYQAKETGEIIKWGQKIIKQDQRSVKVPVSDVVLHMNEANGFDIDPVSRLLSAIEEKYDLKKDKLIVTDYIAAAQTSTTRVNKSLTATANAIVIKDILNTVSKLKPKYTNNLGNMRFLCDVAVVDDIFTEIGDDGHAMFEYFDYENKLAGLKTSRGVIEIVGVEGDFFKNYKSFDNNLDATTTTVTESYVIGGTNEGKVAGMFVDLNATYTLVSSPVSMLQIDNSFADQLTQGFVWAGKIGYFGGAVKLEEAVSMLIVKNS